MSERLTMLMRVGKVRERRAERERREALAKLHECEAQATAAQKRTQAERERCEAAENAFVAAPADPQAQLWRQITSERLQWSTHRSDQAQTRERDALQHHSAASQAHQRAIERGKVLDARRSRDIMLDHLREEIRNEDEFGGGRP